MYCKRLVSKTPSPLTASTAAAPPPPPVSSSSSSSTSSSSNVVNMTPPFAPETETEIETEKAKEIEDQNQEGKASEMEEVEVKLEDALEKLSALFLQQHHRSPTNAEVEMWTVALTGNNSNEEGDEEEEEQGVERGDVERVVAAKQDVVEEETLEKEVKTIDTNIHSQIIAEAEAGTGTEEDDEEGYVVITNVPSSSSVAHDMESDSTNK